MKLFVIAMLAGAAIASAQVQAGRMVGTIYDPQRANVAGATVTVTDVATNLSKRVTTDGAGDYVVTPLDPGTYTLTATAPGFQTTVRGGIELTVGLAARVDLELQIGLATSEVRVTTEAPLLSS